MTQRPAQARRFAKDVTVRAREQARLLGAPRVEAEHLLLALAATPRWPAGALLADEGLDRAGVLAALDTEFERSLGAVGILLLGFHLPEERLPFSGELRLGQSAKLVFRRALRQRAVRRDPRFDSLVLLCGILRADEGVVARALAAAGADRKALLARAEAALSAAA